MLSLVKEGRIATLIIDRPEKKNAISQSMWQSFPVLLDEIAQDPQIRVAILTGRGDCFAAGADIGEFETVWTTRASAEFYLADMGRAQDAIMRSPKPTIAMIRGPCVGGGCGIALSCDMRFADVNARFGITPAKLGMIYTLADIKRLVDAVGFAAAHEMLLSGKLMDAAEAERIGLVNCVAPVDALEPKVHALAALMASNASSSLKGLKTILAMIRDGALKETAASRGLFLDTLEQPDFTEGVAAFRGKRPPRF